MKVDFDESISNVIEVFLKAKSADPGPPLGTVLGNLGVNTLNFCKDFNNFTNNLESYFVIKTQI